MTIEEIQEKCKLMFPVGTTFLSALGAGNTHTIRENDHDTYQILDNDINGGFGKGYLYCKRKYAKVISYPEGYKYKLKSIKKQSYIYLIKLFKELNIK